MRSSFKFILYFLLLLLIILAVGLFLDKDSLVQGLHDSSTLELATSTPALPASAQLNLDILKSPALLPLTNQVINFNFDNICWRPDSFNQPAASAGADLTATDNTASSSEPGIDSAVDNCHPGNNSPFLVILKKKS